jgi:hypothetical protein
MCYYQAEGESERYNKREAVVYQMTKMCKVKGGPSPAASAAQSSSDLQLNTPYQCAGDLTLTAFQCQKQNGQDYSIVKVEQNGKFLMEVPKPQAEIVTQLKACNAGTTFNPPYLAEFPKASDVVQAMVTGTPKDNVTRAMGALYQLTEIINVLSVQRGTYGYSPDEKKLLDNYNKMQSALVQAAQKSFPDSSSMWPPTPTTSAAQIRNLGLKTFQCGPLSFRQACRRGLLKSSAATTRTTSRLSSKRSAPRCSNSRPKPRLHSPNRTRGKMPDRLPRGVAWSPGEVRRNVLAKVLRWAWLT